MIKQEVIEYRNTHRESRTLLGTLLGEFDIKSKNPTDAECIIIIKKMIENNNICGIKGENEILELFIPKQLTDLEISQIISKQEFAFIGVGMNYFKNNYAGLYNGKVVSNLIGLYLNSKC